MDVDGKLQDSKLKTVSVGGLAKPDGKIQHGFRGCIQVCPLCRPHSCLRLWSWRRAVQFDVLKFWFKLSFIWICLNSCLCSLKTSCFTPLLACMIVSLQGLRVGGAVSLSQARKLNVEQGCSVPDPCSSNPCPSNSYCSDDWDSHSCKCINGQSRHMITNPRT